MAFFAKQFIEAIPQHEGETLTLAGMVWRVRDHGKVAFCDLQDATGTVQIVATSDAPDALHTLRQARPMTPVVVRGMVRRRPEKLVNPKERFGKWEVGAEYITVLAEPEEPPFDLDSDDISIETLLDYRPVTARRPRERAIFRIQAGIVRAYRKALEARHFTEIQAPKIVGGDAEGGANVFPVQYLRGVEAALATSPQLYKQIMVGAFERVFAVGPVFRAEKHATTRHLNEYVSLDAEMGFIEDHRDVMRILEGVIRDIVAAITQEHAYDLALLGAHEPLVPHGEFPVIRLPEALALITERTGRDVRNEPDLSPEDERWLSTWAREEHNSDFLFVTHYPTHKRPFYTKPDPEDPELTRSFDLLFRGVEITTGGQRLHLAAEYEKRLKERGLDPKVFSFYLMAFRYGMPPHGGWGMGLERLTQKMCGLASVKEATLFVRDITRIDSRLATQQEELSHEA
ncbi:aspartate--tRNA(Asn) ligase [Candidatus Parcubacteria bacterium]|nr:MAG: aspartate--tRNA(Asn) ligase [Candidatus Parcubacteria bacterium]